MQLKTIAAQLTLLVLLQSYCTAQTARAQDAFAAPTLAPGALHTTVAGQQLEQFFSSLDQKSLIDFQAYNNKTPEELFRVNLDIFAKAEILNRFKRIEVLPEPKYIAAGIELTEDAKVAALMGDMAQTSILQKQLLSVMQKPLYFSRGQTYCTDQAWQALLNADTNNNVSDLLDQVTSAGRNAYKQTDTQEYNFAQELITKIQRMSASTLSSGGSAMTSKQEQNSNPHYRYDLIKQVLKCSKNKDINGTASALAKLTAIYDSEPGYCTSDQNQLNMFCALLNIARKLSDNDMLSESSNLLTQLDRAARGKELTPAAQSLVRAEQIINQTRKTAKQANPATIETQHLFVLPEMMALSRIDQLRSMGLAYFYAHEYERASVFYDLASQATQVQEQDKCIESNTDSKIRLLLDKACLKATLSDFKNADDLVHQALSMLPDSNLAKVNSASLVAATPSLALDENPKEPKIDRYRRKEKERIEREKQEHAFALAESKRLYAKKIIISKMAELADIYRQHQNSQTAIDYLKQVAAIAKAKMPDQKEDTFDYDASDSLLQATLAQLYESINKPDLALSLYGYAVDSAADRSGAMLFLQYANCAARLGKHKLAAKNYATFLERAYSLPHNIVDRQPDWRISYLRKAYSESLQAPDSDKHKQEALGERLVAELQGHYPASKEMIEIYKTLIANSTDELRKYDWRVNITMKELQMKNEGNLYH